VGVRPSFSAFSRSMSAYSEGAPELYRVKTPAKCGSLFAAATSVLAALAGSCGVRSPRSSTISLKPPAAPRPWTGGGFATMIPASLIPAKAALTLGSIVAALTPGAW
jgi:hypothetical protein